jgi:hypothetical protein
LGEIGDEAPPSETAYNYGAGNHFRQRDQPMNVPQFRVIKTEEREILINPNPVSTEAVGIVAKVTPDDILQTPNLLHRIEVQLIAQVTPEEAQRGMVSGAWTREIGNKQENARRRYAFFGSNFQSQIPADPDNEFSKLLEAIRLNAKPAT